MIIVRYILDEDEDTEDADEDRSSFHSRTTMFEEVRKSHYSEAKTPKASFCPILMDACDPAA